MDTTTLGAALALARNIPDTAVSEAQDVLEQAQAVAESLPEDYTELSEDVTDLKSALNSIDINAVANMQGSISSYQASNTNYKRVSEFVVGKTYRVGITVNTTGTYNVQTSKGDSSAYIVDTLEANASLQANVTKYYYYTPSDSGIIYMRLSSNSVDWSISIAEILKTKEVKETADSNKELLDIFNDYPITTIPGKFISKLSGYQANSDDYYATDYIPVSSYIWLLTYGASTDTNAGYSFYDDNKDPVEDSYAGIYAISGIWTKLTVPSGAKYFRTSCKSTQVSKLQIRIPLTENVIRLLADDVYNSIDGITYVINGYYTNNAGEIGDFVPDNGYVSKVLMVHPGEVYYITGTGGSNGRLWSTHFSNGATNRIADPGESHVQNGIKITIESGEKYLVFNSTNSAARYGIVPGDHARSTFNTRDILLDERKTQDALIENTYSFCNNMSTEKEALPYCKIYNNGVEDSSGYGKTGREYRFSIPHAKCHIYFEFRMTEPVPSTRSDSITTNKKLLVNTFDFGKAYLFFQGSEFTNTELFQEYVIRAESGSNGGGFRVNEMYYKRLNGKDSFSLQYTNTITNSSSCTVVFTDSKCTITVDGTETEINTTSSMTVDALIDAINNITGISATAILTNGKTYGDLLPVVSKGSSSSTTVDLIYSGTLYNGTSYKDNPPIYIPLALNEEWHSFEMIVDPSDTVICSIDGICDMRNIDSSVTPTNVLSINPSGLPIIIRNLEFNHGNTGDAEIVDNQWKIGSSVGKYIISSHTPRLLIYEGHGIVDSLDKDMPTGETVLSASTERIEILFREAKARGYVPVTWEQIIDWKINGTPLPKRCYTIAFDDWRFENYVDYNKRKPFVDYNVMPCLDVVTNEHALTDTVEINDTTYTAEQCVDICNQAGWYLTSHTHGHYRLTDYKPSELPALLKTSALEADKYKIHSNVLVYPYGEYIQAFEPIFRNSDFALGVNVVTRIYNVRGTSDYYLSRVELGNRVSLEEVLYPLT